jgi:hypothetical protein
LFALLDSFDAAEMVRFDARFRAWRYSRSPFRRTVGRGRWSGAGAAAFEKFLGLVSTDGYRRQSAVEDVALRPCVATLIAIRATEWVPEVRAAALVRLRGLSADEAVALLPVVETLSRGRERAAELAEVIAERLSDHDLARATGSPNDHVRRVAWRWLIDRDAQDPVDVARRAARDRDVVVRSLAADLRPAMSVDDRREAASALVQDHVGSLAARGLESLVGIEGDQPIIRALRSRSASLRRSAQGWAALRHLDAATEYRSDLEADPADETALIGLAEVAEQKDLDMLVGALRNTRARVCAAALKAVWELDPDRGEEAAMEQLEAGAAGRVSRTAAVLLRRRATTRSTTSRIEAVALDAHRPLDHRLRAASVLRRARWLHLAVLLRIFESEPHDPRTREEIRQWFVASANITRGPSASIRAVIDSAARALDDRSRAQLDFLFRTTRA